MNNNGKISFEGLRSKISNEISRAVLPLSVSALATTSLLSLMALEFTGITRDIIKQRSGNNSELDPRFKGDIFKMERMHKDHRRENPWYNDPENGIMGTVGQHHSNLIGGIFNSDGSINEGGVDHTIFFNPDMKRHFTPQAIKMFLEKYGSTEWLWKYSLPEWDENGKAKGDDLGKLSRAATHEERRKGICRVEVPLKISKKGETTERLHFVTFEEIYSGKQSQYRKII